MSVLALHCSLCKANFKGKAQWNDHLLQNRHQQLARRELLIWEEPDRACVLVVYGTVAVGRDLQIIQHLSQDLRTFVTDFVWWEERPRVGFLQFESEAKVREVVASLVDQQFRLGDKQLCEVKEGRSIREPEWVGLLPDCVSPNLREDSPERNDVPRPQGPPSPAVITISSDDDDNESEAMDTGQPVGGDDAEMEEQEENQEQVAMEDTENIDEYGPSPAEASSPSNESGGLAHYLKAIRKLVEVPDEDFHTAVDILHRIQTNLSNIRNPGSIATWNAVVSRLWNLKLAFPSISLEKLGKANKTNTYFTFTILLYKYMETENDPHLASMKLTAIHKIVKEFWTTSPGGARRFLNYDVVRSTVERNASGGCGMMRYSIKIPDSERIFKLGIVANPTFMVEAQTWRLTQYLHTFDPHLAPVSAVIYYWASVNDVVMGSRQGKYDHLPHPLGLNWLLLFFFQWEKLIPSAKLILDQPHEPLMFHDGVDIGFAEDEEFATSWIRENKPESVGEDIDMDSDSFAKEVFTLVWRFFEFCISKLGSSLSRGKKTVFNPRTGEIHLKTNFRKSKLLKRTEKAVISEYFKNKDQDEKTLLLSPFSVKWRISTSTNAKGAFQQMGVIGRKLKDQLDIDKRSGSSRSPQSKANVASFLQLFKL